MLIVRLSPAGTTPTNSKISEANPGSLGSGIVPARAFLL
jgi:hypothetical protein